MHQRSPFSQNEFIFLTLLLKMVVASLASVMARSKTFENLLFAEKKNFKEKMHLVFLLGAPLGIGVGARLLLDYAAADISLEGSFITAFDHYALKAFDLSAVYCVLKPIDKN